MDWLEGALSPDVRAAVDAHAAGCPRCAAFIECYRETPRILREATATTLDAGQQQSLRDFLRAQRGAPPAEH